MRYPPYASRPSTRPPATTEAICPATFAALGVIPILFLAQLAFIVAFGVLLDTFIVRTLLVPALVYDIGPRVWWPAKPDGTRPDRAAAAVGD